MLILYFVIVRLDEYKIDFSSFKEVLLYIVLIIIDQLMLSSEQSIPFRVINKLILLANFSSKLFYESS